MRPLLILCEFVVEVLTVGTLTEAEQLMRCVEEAKLQRWLLLLLIGKPTASEVKECELISGALDNLQNKNMMSIKGEV